MANCAVSKNYHEAAPFIWPGLVASALALACNQAGDYSSARGKRERVNVVTSQHELLTGESDEVPALIATAEPVVVFCEES